jgi:dienelactone hydrolase
LTLCSGTIDSVPTPQTSLPTALSLTRTAAPRGQVRGVVLMLHGGRVESREPVQRRNASWWRMALLQQRLGSAARSGGAVVELLRYAERGWNARHGPKPAPITDGLWALDQIRERHGEVPVVLVGHSMGGRTACALADAPGVQGVVALAPWLPPGEPVHAAAGQRIVIAHGLMDRWTSARGSLDWSRRARGAGAKVARFEIPRVGHFMFARTNDWNTIVRHSALGLLGVGPLPQALQTAFTQPAWAYPEEAGLRLAPSQL